MTTILKNAVYKQRILDRNFHESEILPIYYKTEDQSDLSPVIKEGYQALLRQEVILILNEYIGSNQILIDYREHLKNIQCSVESYKTLEIKKDTYLQLEQKKLCFKIMVRNNSERKSEREASYRAII